MARRKVQNSIDRPKSANPPDTERDLETGKYIVDKKAAFRQWFKDAKNKTHDKAGVTKNICPKQVIYGSNAYEDKGKNKK